MIEIPEYNFQGSIEEGMGLVTLILTNQWSIGDAYSLPETLKHQHIFLYPRKIQDFSMSENLKLNDDEFDHRLMTIVHEGETINFMIPMFQTSQLEQQLNRAMKIDQ